MAAYATDFTEKSLAAELPRRQTDRLSVRRPVSDHIERPAGGYLWDRAAERRLATAITASGSITPGS